MKKTFCCWIHEARRCLFAYRLLLLMLLLLLAVVAAVAAALFGC